MGTITVAYNDLEKGRGSKKTTVVYDGASPMLKVAPNVPNHFECNAVIENLVIDGAIPGGGLVQEGILLEDVYNCVIRNLTIKNCETGIAVKNTAYDFSVANRFEHIRMINVKKGIEFTGTPSKQNFAYTIIDDVGISLAKDTTTGASNAFKGIHVGSNAKLHNAFIRATAWLKHNDHKGLLVDGEIKYSLVNFEVESEAESTGMGVQISSGGVVNDNQSFLLTTMFANPGSVAVYNQNGIGYDDIVVAN